MSKMNYDAADLAAIESGAAANGLRLDEGESIFLARELDYVKSKVYETEYPNLMATTLFPVTSEAPGWAKTISYSVLDAVGMARIIADYSDDLPAVGVNAREETARIFHLGNFYEYSLDEIRASMATGKNLPTRLATAARRAHDVKTNDLAFSGDAKYNIVGVLDHPNIPVTVSAGWSTAAIAQSELTSAFANMVGVTKGLHSANYVALPPSVWATLTLPIPNTSVSTLAYIKEQYPGVTFVQVNELENVEGQRVALIMERAEENASLEIPQPFEQLPPQARSLHFEVPCHSKTAGVLVYLPLTLSLIKGI